MEDTDFVKKIENNGINLQLYISDILRNNGWDCGIDKLYTDDETKITREIDLSCHKKIPDTFIIPKKLLSDRKLVVYSELFGDSIKMPTNVYLSIECKYTKHKDGWVFFASNKTFEDNTLHRIIKRFPHKIFGSTSSYFNFKDKDNVDFRTKETVVITETALDLSDDNKKNIRESMMGVIKHLVFLLRNHIYPEFSVWGFRNNFINKILPEWFKKAFGTNIGFPILEIFYPIVVVDGKLFLYRSNNKKIEEKKHLIINQSYLSKTFLDDKKIEKLGRSGYGDEIDFYVDFVTKEEFPEFIRKIEEEILSIIKIANRTFEEMKIKI